LPAAFADVQEGPAGHFRLHFFAAILCLANYLYHLKQGERHGLGRALEAFPFLGRYLNELGRYLPERSGWRASITWMDRQIAAWERDRERELPLARAFPSRAERIALLFIGLVEEDSRFGALFAALEERPGARRPTLETVEAVMAGAGFPQGACARLLECGAVAAVDTEAPRAEWELRIPLPVWLAVRGETPQGDWFRFVGQGELPPADQLPGDIAAEVLRAAELLRDGKAAALIVRGSPGSDRLRAVGSCARILGRNLLVVDAGAPKAALGAHWLGVLATLTGSLPVFQADPPPGETHTIPALRGAGPVAVACGLFGGVVLETGCGVDGIEGAPAVAIALPRLGPEEREAVWRASLGEFAPADLRAVSERYRLPSGYIRRAAKLAAARAGLAGRATVALEDIRIAVRLLGRETLETLATPLEPAGSWSDLVASAAVLTRLREVYARCRHRERISGALGRAFSTQSNRGVRALFTGPSGTGKTLAAKILAAELGMDLYRIDLSAVVSKFVGETEKNLHRALTAAEELDVVLLLDEGDSLLARRSEVRGANDRYANLETNFLLQRLEGYEGIALITTNAMENIDPAFQRRMDVVVAFSPPGPGERLAIWRLHLPAEHAVDPEFLERVALECVLTGGQIRSAAQHAALLALEDGGRIQSAHLKAAVQAEYRKTGALCPLESDDASGPVDRRSSPAAFMQAIAVGGRSHGRRGR